MCCEEDNCKESCVREKGITNTYGLKDFILLTWLSNIRLLSHDHTSLQWCYSHGINMGACCSSRNSSPSLPRGASRYQIFPDNGNSLPLRYSIDLSTRRHIPPSTAHECCDDLSEEFPEGGDTIIRHTSSNMSRQYATDENRFDL